MNRVLAKRLFLDQYEKSLMSDGDYFTLTKLLLPYRGVLYTKKKKQCFEFDLENEKWVKKYEKNLSPGIKEDKNKK